MLGKFEELMVMLVIILVLFGAKKLPELARSIGLSVREIKNGFNGQVDEKPAKHESETAANANHKSA
jgi:sec-independent protein translocase protein TatA